MLIRNCVSEMTNLLTESLARAWNRQGNQVVGDHDKSPVCLDALPGAHKHVAEGQMLFDVLMKDLDSEALAVKLDHLGFGHVQIVGDQKPHFFGATLGDEQKNSSHLGKPDEFLCNLEFSFLGKLNGLVSPRSLGQVTDDDLLAADFQNAIALESRNESPACFYNRIEDRGAGIPAVHKNGHRSTQLVLKACENLEGQIDLAFESPLRRSALGLVTGNRPSQALGSEFQDTSHGALPSEQPVGRMMDAEALNLFALSRASRIVDDHQNFPRAIGPRSNQGLIGFQKALSFLWRAVEKTLEIVGQRLGKLDSDLPSRMKLDQPDQTDQVEKKMFDLRFGHSAQEISQSGRSFCREKFSHGFRVLLALAGIGDFDRKPFVLKTKYSLVT